MDKKILPTSFSEAIKSASKFYFTSKPCRKGHLSKRLTVNSTCYECILSNRAMHRKKVKEMLEVVDKEQLNTKNTPYDTPHVSPDDVPSNASCYPPSDAPYHTQYHGGLDAPCHTLPYAEHEQPRNRSDWIVCPGKPHKKIKITEEIREIFEYWCFVMGKTNRTILDYDRASAIKQGLDMTDIVNLKLAIDGCKLDEWHMGGNDRKTVYNEPIHIFKSMAKIEKFIELTKPKPFELKLNANGLIAVEDLRTAYNNGFFSSD